MAQGLGRAARDPAVLAGLGRRLLVVRGRHRPARPAPLLAFGLGGFAAGAAIRQIVLATRRQGWRGFVGRANGGMIVHLGVVMIAVAFAASQSYAQDAEFTLREGESGVVGGHEVTYLGLTTEELPEKTIIRAQVQIDGGQVYEPSLSQFVFGSQAIGAPSVKTGPIEDIYLALLDRADEPGDPMCRG